MDDVLVLNQGRALVIGSAVGFFLVLAGIARMTPWPVSDWRTILTVAGLGVLVSYVLHRYIRMQLHVAAEIRP